MEEIISKKELDELMKIKEMGRGAGVKAHGEFIFKEKGEEGLKKLEETMAGLGYPIKYREIRAMELFPISSEALTLLIIKKLFDFNDEKFQEMGEFVLKFSMVIRLFVKYFISMDKLLKEASMMWKKGGSAGDLKIIRYDKDNRSATLRLENYRLHPIYCPIFEGYLLGAIKMIVKSEAKIEETKCVYRGDEYHEFVLNW